MDRYGSPPRYYEDENTYSKFKRHYGFDDSVLDNHDPDPYYRSLWEREPMDYSPFHGATPFILSPRSKNELLQSMVEPLHQEELKPKPRYLDIANKSRFEGRPIRHRNADYIYKDPIDDPSYKSFQRPLRSTSLSPSITPSRSPSKCKPMPADTNITYEWTIFIKGFSQTCTKQDLTQFFEQRCETEIIHVALPISRTTGMNRRIAWVSLADSEGLRRALAINGQDVLGGRVHVEMSKNDRSQLLNKTTVFVWGLSNTFNRADLEQLFMFAGSIKGIRIPKNANSRPIAFIEYHNHADARRSLVMDGRLYRGHKIHVDFARSSNKQ